MSGHTRTLSGNAEHLQKVSAATRVATPDGLGRADSLYQVTCSTRFYQAGIAMEELRVIGPSCSLIVPCSAHCGSRPWARFGAGMLSRQIKTRAVPIASRMRPSLMPALRQDDLLAEREKHSPWCVFPHRTSVACSHASLLSVRMRNWCPARELRRPHASS